MKKTIVLLGIIVGGLLSISFYSTYAMYVAVQSDTSIDLTSNLNYEFNINDETSFTVPAASVIHFNAVVKNPYSGEIKYALYHNYTGTNSNITIGEVVNNKTTTTTAPNTEGTIAQNAQKVIPIAIINNSSSSITVSFGLLTGYTSNTLSFASNQKQITDVVDNNDVANVKCANELVYNEESCYQRVENNILNTYCDILVNSVLDPNLDKSGANAPVLADGMIPVYYSGGSWKKADSTNSNSTYQWYDYDTQKWANAVVIADEEVSIGTTARDYYMNASVGTNIDETSILAYYVWIPRYKYKLFNASYASSTQEQVIDVVFESGTNTTGTVKCTYASNGAETCTNKSNGNYYTHPAFTLGDTELKGIWVGKFETTGSETTPTVKPGITSLRNITVSSMYNASKVFNTTTYLTETGVNQSDAHMMKNIEWGAVAYLKQSIYGLGITNIERNNNSSNKTGCGTTAGSSVSDTCNAYNTTKGMLASTTGNITGVYDMSGGAEESVMGNYNKTAGSSGLTVSNIPSKYIDIYAGTDVSYSHLGDATGETAGWYSDYERFVRSSYPWFRRGGYYDISTSNNGVFEFNYYNGTSGTRYGFRVVLSTTGA